MSGTFNGAIVGFDPTACGGYGGTILTHTLNDNGGADTITTSGDLGCATGGDGISTLEITETLNLDTGTGIYEGLQDGGQVILTGTLGLETGINSFRVEGDVGSVCFDW